MRDRPRTAHFGEQAVASGGISFEIGRQELQRDGLAEPEVVGAVDLAHAAAPDQRDDAVAVGQDVARCEAVHIDRL